MWQRPNRQLKSETMMSPMDSDGVNLRKMTRLMQECAEELERAGYEDPAYYFNHCLLYTSPSPRDGLLSRMPSSA